MLAGLLPPKLAWQYSRLEPYGLFMVIGLLITGVLGKILWPLVFGVIEWMPASEVIRRVLEIL